jgi:hypothetical protein
MDKLEFDNAFTGKPESKKYVIYEVLTGYVIREVLGHIYSISTSIKTNKYKCVFDETYNYWVIRETLNTIFPTDYVLFKNKKTAEYYIKELLNMNNNNMKCTGEINELTTIF